MYVEKETGKIFDRDKVKRKFKHVSLPKEISTEWLDENGFAKIVGEKMPAEEPKRGQHIEATKKAILENGEWLRVNEIVGEEKKQKEMDVDEKREAEYPSMSDFRDAYVKQAIADRKQGKVFTKKMDRFLDKYQEINNKYPKNGEDQDD